MDIRHRKITVLGLGRSGLSTARWLSKQGAEVTVSEVKRLHELDQQVVGEMSALGVRLETGGHRPETFLDSNLIIISPGVPHDLGPLIMAGRKGIPILGEMELASRFMDTPIVAVTGTNGKSTVTAFLGSLLKKAGHRVFVGGNIGTPLIDYVAGGEKTDYAVVEVSSFQLDTAETFSPHVAILLNISPDHLDRYPSYEAYEESKLKIFRNQGAGQYAVLNDDDPRVTRFRPSGGATVLRYGMESGEGRQAYAEGRNLLLAFPGKKAFHLDLQGFSLPGRHNLQNLMAGVLAGLALDVEPAIIQETILSFRGLPHRVEWVGSVKGVNFYDDSKATNVDAALRSLLSFERPILLIAGGRHKGADYAPLVKAAKDRVRKVILLGESSPLLAEAFNGVVPMESASDMEEAVRRAFSSARVDDVVLLAPACSSFDMFRDY
ncbi:MAG: UDP-N-acetylmuramoyl-L-alanine--D-glutamate ligase, partial [Deltaproteobacteria bacterium]|nr:UDP-N-acetylmuramoyl-L-alanine--D-glutamate ligase [Deltaproteobacteria bacterium]